MNNTSFRPLRTILFTAIAVGIIHDASALFFPGETLNPNCSPTDPNCTVDIFRINNAKSYKFFDADNSHFVGLKSPTDILNNLTLVLPSSMGTAGQFLTTDGSGNLTWGTGTGVLPSQPGNTGKYLQTDGNNAQWVTLAGGGGGSAPSGNSGAIQFTDGTNFTADATNLFWDNTTKALGIGTTTPKQPLEVKGNINIDTGSLLLTNSGKYVGFTAPAGMAGNTVYTLPNALPTGGSKILQASPTGELSWVDASSTGGGMGVFVGKTTTPHKGKLNSGGKIGYPAANELCRTEFPGSHICSQTEMIFSISQLDLSTRTDWTGAAWTSTGGAKYSPAPIPVNDCNGFTHDNTNLYLGSFWMFDPTDGGSGGVGHCANEIPLACCQ